MICRSGIARHHADKNLLAGLTPGFNFQGRILVSGGSMYSGVQTFGPG